eukprot:3492895-Pleurochrysis_carterae.AAC.4
MPVARACAHACCVRVTVLACVCLHKPPARPPSRDKKATDRQQHARIHIRISANVATQSWMPKLPKMVNMCKSSCTVVRKEKSGRAQRRMTPVDRAR